MYISELAPEREPQYDEMALQYGTIFCTTQWANLFAGRIKRYGIYDKGGSLAGGFYTYLEKKFGFSVYRNPPFTPSVGFFARIGSSNPAAVIDEWKKILSVTADFIEGESFTLVMCSFDAKIIDMQPFIWKGFKVSPRYTYILDLSITNDDMWKRLSHERRKNIVKGAKDGLVVKIIHDFTIIKDLVLKTYSRQSKEANEFYLNKILFEFADDSNSISFATFQGGQPIACSFCVYDRSTAYYIIGGYDSQQKHHGAGALSMWAAINYAKEAGLRYFDFEGSMSPQIERYFRGFGGQLTPYYQIAKTSLPLELLLKFYRRDLF
ncbi:MAG: GNAT family N-acetyltransferase [Nitrospirae bacterium]|nr:GNAT family N-acetyltransferase [Nitrospirota bacterium]